MLAKFKDAKEGKFMTGGFSLVLSLMLLVSCQSIRPSRSTQKEQEKNNGLMAQRRDISSTQKQEIPDLAATWDTRIHFVNFTPVQEEKVRQAVDILKKVIATKEFKERLINFTYKGKKQFVDSAGRTNEEIYQMILDGAERIGDTSKNNTMDVELELYHQATKTIGYTYPNTVRIWMNKKYFNRYTPLKVADNLMHEWMHKLGFSHETSWSRDRDYSVPYAIGYLIEELAPTL